MNYKIQNTQSGTLCRYSHLSPEGGWQKSMP